MTLIFIYTYCLNLIVTYFNLLFSYIEPRPSYLLKFSGFWLHIFILWIYCMLIYECLFWDFYLLAEELSLFFLLCIILNSSLHICVLNVRIVHQVSHGWWLSHSLEGNETFPSICDTYDILFCLSMVCWWSYWISFISHWYQPGQFHCVGFILVMLFYHCFVLCKVVWGWEHDSQFKLSLMVERIFTVCTV